MGKAPSGLTVALAPFGALFASFLAGTFFRAPLPAELLGFAGLVVIGGIDTVMGGVRSQLEGKFHADIFLTGFLGNAAFACLLAWIGDKIGLNLFLVVSFVFAWRIFVNFSLIRRILLTRWHDERQRQRLESERMSQEGMN